MNPDNQKKYMRFEMEEAKWLDSMVRQYIPKWMQWVVEKNIRNVIGRIGHVLVDVVWIKIVQGIKISRNQDTVILGGTKGWRKGMDHGYKISHITTRLNRRGKEIAFKKFHLDITIKK